MAKTLANLRTEIRTYLDEAQEADFLDEEVDLSANRAYHDVVKAVIGVWEEYYSTTTPFTYATVAGQQEYTIDTTIIKVDRVEINYNPAASNSTPARALPIKKDEVRANLANTNFNSSIASPVYYVHGPTTAQKIGFLPIPTVSDVAPTKSISVWGITLPVDLVNASDNVNIPYADNFAYLISLKAASQLLRKGQQEEQTAGNYIAEYRNGILEMQTFLKERQADDGMYIVDSMLEDEDFTLTGF